MKNPNDCSEFNWDVSNIGLHLATLNTDQLRELGVRCMRRLADAGHVRDIRCLHLVETAIEFEEARATLRKAVIAAQLVEMYGKCRFKRPYGQLVAYDKRFGGDVCVWSYARLFGWESLNSSANTYKIDLHTQLDLHRPHLGCWTLPSWGRSYDAILDVLMAARHQDEQREARAQVQDLKRLGGRITYS